MTRLLQRKTKLQFETGCELRERGKYRAVIIEADDLVARVRLKGTRKRFLVDWAAIYDFAAKCEATKLRAEKRAAKKGTR